MHLLGYLSTAEVSPPDNTLSKTTQPICQNECVCVCVCATKHRCQLPAADPSGLLLGELSCPEQTLELDLGGKDTAEERTGVERGRGSDQKQLNFSFFFPFLPARKGDTFVNQRKI